MISNIQRNQFLAHMNQIKSDENNNVRMRIKEKKRFFFNVKKKYTNKGKHRNYTEVKTQNPKLQKSKSKTQNQKVKTQKSKDKRIQLPTKLAHGPQKSPEFTAMEKNVYSVVNYPLTHTCSFKLR